MNFFTITTRAVPILSHTNEPRYYENLTIKKKITINIVQQYSEQEILLRIGVNIIITVYSYILSFLNL